MLKWPYVNVSSCDTWLPLKGPLKELEGSLEGIALGKVAGDVVKMAEKLSDIQWPIDAILSGPPCPPWAGQGRRQDIGLMGCESVELHEDLQMPGSRFRPPTLSFRLASKHCGSVLV